MSTVDMSMLMFHFRRSKYEAIVIDSTHIHTNTHFGPRSPSVFFF